MPSLLFEETRALEKWRLFQPLRNLIRRVRGLRQRSRANYGLRKWGVANHDSDSAIALMGDDLAASDSSSNSFLMRCNLHGLYLWPE
jgi:hypothetical protein